jgi:lysophospholipase L1-like esterase
MIHLPKPYLSLLLLAVVFSLTGCQSPKVKPDPAAVKWEATIQAFESADHDAPPPKGALLLAGSSSFRMWKSAAQDFPGKQVINRGFGGSQMSDLLYYTDRIVIPYEPVEILVYEGDNDLAAGESPEIIFNEFKEFTRIVLKALPASKVYFVAVKPSPSRTKLMGEMSKTNRLIADYCNGKERLEFIDVFTPMLNSDGQPRAELFVADQLHMNTTGYALWTKIVRKKMGLPELVGADQ